MIFVLIQITEVDLKLQLGDFYLSIFCFNFPYLKQKWAQAKQDSWQNVPVSLPPCHVLNREYTDISITSEISAVGAGVRAGSILRGGWWARGGWWGRRNLYHWAAPSLAAMSLWSMSGWLSSPVLILRGEWGCFKWDFGGLEGGDVFSFRWSDEIGLCRVACMKRSRQTGTQTEIKTAIAR